MDMNAGVSMQEFGLESCNDRPSPGIFLGEWSDCEPLPDCRGGAQKSPNASLVSYHYSDGDAEPKYSLRFPRSHSLP